MPSQHPELASLYPQHLATLAQRTGEALAATGFDHLLIAAGQLHYQFLDDRDYVFAVNPHFKHWLPLTDAPGSWLVVTPGEKPRLVFLQPRDYWHVVPSAPSGYWVEHFDIRVIHAPEHARQHLPATGRRLAILGEANAALDGYAPNNPEPLLARLHWARARKTPYEIALMREANRIGARAHRAAAEAFHAGASEFAIHLAYLAAAEHAESELPYGNIVALNEHGAVLHYSRFDRRAPARSHSFLLDAGASFQGYASDITRTHAATGEDDFAALVASVDAAQQGFAAMVRASQGYPELHIHAHHVLAGVLREHGVIRMAPESAVESGLSAAFFPHGLGHFIGAQVHDVAGFQASPEGGTIPRPPGHPYLRMTRTLEPGMVVTIEPGLYFIDLLLAELKAGPLAGEVDWARIDALRPFGGIRIEDDVACTTGDPENLTRQAFASIG